MIDPMEIDAADHLKKFVVQSAKRMGLPLCEWDDIAGDTLLEIAQDLSASRFSSLLREIGESEEILDVLRGKRNGLSGRHPASPEGASARRAIRRVLARSKFPMSTFTDIGMHDEVDDES